MAQNKANDNWRYSSVALASEDLGKKILTGLKWPDKEDLQDWQITPKKQFHATLSAHGPLDDETLKALKKIYKEVSQRHPPIKGATLSLGNSFGKASEYKDGGKPHLFLLHLDPVSHFKLTEYWMDLHKSLGKKFRQGRADRFMHYTLARIPFDQQAQAIKFLEDNKDFISEPFDITPGLYSHRKSPEGQRGYHEEELFPLQG